MRMEIRSIGRGAAPGATLATVAMAAALPTVALLTALLTALLGPAPAAAQSAAALRFHDPMPLDRGTEIALARSAAPPSVSAGAAVLVLEAGRFVPAVEGTNGVTCYVARSVPGSLEPHCFDREGSATILPIHLRRAEMGYAGASAEEVDAEIARGLEEGRYRLPARPAMSYMLSSAQILYSDEGGRAGAWRPHLMIYQPGLTSADLGLPPEPGTPVFVVDEGTPESVILVVLDDFVEPDLAESDRVAIEAASLEHDRRHAGT